MCIEKNNFIFDFFVRLSNQYYKDNFYFPWSKKQYQVLTPKNMNKNCETKALPLMMISDNHSFPKKKTMSESNLNSYFIHALVIFFRKQFEYFYFFRLFCSLSYFSVCSIL